MRFITAIPAYGRDYNNKSEVIKDWNANKDFLISCPLSNGGYINKMDIELQFKPAIIKIRFSKLRKVAIINIG